jgi:hypothetical protein
MTAVSYSVCPSWCWGPLTYLGNITVFVHPIWWVWICPLAEVPAIHGAPKCGTIFTKIIKVKQSRYRPGVTQRVPGSYGSHITWQQHRMVVRLSALRTSRLYPQEMLLVLISVRGRIDPRAIVQSEGLCQWKIPMTPSLFKPATFRFACRMYPLFNKNQAAWNFLSHEPEVTWHTVVIIIQVVLLSPYFHSWLSSVFHSLQSITPRIY